MKITVMYQLIHLMGMTDNSSPMPNIATPTNDNCARPTRTWPPAPTIHLAEYITFWLHQYQDYQIKKLSDLRLSTDRTLSKLSDHQIINRSNLISLGSWPRSTVTRKAAGTDALLVTKVIIILWWSWWWWDGVDDDEMVMMMLFLVMVMVGRLRRSCLCYLVLIF